MRGKTLVIAVAAVVAVAAVAAVIAALIWTAKGGGRGSPPDCAYAVRPVSGDGNCFYNSVHAALQGKADDVFGRLASPAADLRRLVSDLVRSDEYRDVLDTFIRLARDIGASALEDDLGKLAKALEAGDEDAIHACIRTEWATQVEVTVMQRYLFDRHRVVLMVTPDNPADSAGVAGQLRALGAAVDAGDPDPGDAYWVIFVKKAGGGNHYDAWVRADRPVPSKRKEFVRTCLQRRG